MVREMPRNERPREKMLQEGAKALSNAELLAILLRTGSKAESVTHLAERVLAQYAQDVLHLSYDPERPLSFAQDQAYARGAMQALEHLLSSPIPHTPEN